jgi:hydroxypyruvate isomerase
MPKFAANLSMLFPDLPFLDRFGAAATAGFDAVEFMFPYEHGEVAIAEQLRRHELQLVLHNLPAGDWGRGDRGLAALPGREVEFRDGVRRAVECATALGCPRLNCLAGIVAPELRERARATLIENLRFAATVLGEAGIGLLMEPINTRDMPGFFVSRSADAFAIMDEVGADNLQLQYDIYHAQVMEGDLTHTLATRLPRIGHIQIADNPGRHEPGTGEINFRFLFERLDDLGYTGWVGCEYRPTGDTLTGLGWLAPYR